MPDAIIGKLIPSLGRCTFSMVRKPVLVPVDSHQVLQTHGDTRLLVSLEFGQVDNTIGVHHSLRDQVLVDPVAVVEPQFFSVIFSAVQEMTQMANLRK